MQRVFISYSSKDKVQVDGLANLLEALDHEIFYDRRTFKAGRRWRDELYGGLDRSEALFVFWTRHAANSKWVRNEIEYFQEKHPNGLIVPVYGDETELEPYVSEFRIKKDVWLNELLLIKRDLAEKGIPRKVIEAALLRKLKDRGIEIDEKRKRALFAMVGLGVGVTTGLLSHLVTIPLSRVTEWFAGLSTAQAAAVVGATTLAAAAGVGIPLLQDADPTARGQLTLQVNKGIPLYAWRLIDVTDRSKIIDGDAKSHTISVPAGEYVLETLPFASNCKWVRWPERFRVEPDESGTLPALESGVKLDLPKEFPEVWSWRLVSAENPKNVVQYYASDRARTPEMLAPPGNYHLEILPFVAHCQWVRWPETITVEPSKFKMLPVESGVKLDLPKESPEVWAWRLVSAENPKNVVQYYSSDRAKTSEMLVPPGRYHLEIRPFFSGCRRVRWPDVIAVEQDKFKPFAVDSVRPEFPDEYKEVYSWKLVQTSDPQETVQEYSGSTASKRRMLVPAGEYDVFVRLTAETSYTKIGRVIVKPSIPEYPPEDAEQAIR